MEDCIFCKIARGEITSNKVYEDEDVVAFLDIHPQAKTHILIIPRIHMRDALECQAEAPGLFPTLMETAVKVAKLSGLSDGGFRIGINTGANAKQSVAHVHVHVLGGEPLNERMG